MCLIRECQAIDLFQGPADADAAECVLALQHYVAERKIEAALAAKYRILLLFNRVSLCAASRFSAALALAHHQNGHCKY